MVFNNVIDRVTRWFLSHDITGPFMTN